MLAHPRPPPSWEGGPGISIAFESDGSWTEIAHPKLKHEIVGSYSRFLADPLCLDLRSLARTFCEITAMERGAQRIPTTEQLSEENGNYRFELYLPGSRWARMTAFSLSLAA
jgi:hypothetical protein